MSRSEYTYESLGDVRGFGGGAGLPVRSREAFAAAPLRRAACLIRKVDLSVLGSLSEFCSVDV